MSIVVYFDTGLCMYYLKTKVFNIIYIFISWLYHIKIYQILIVIYSKFLIVFTIIFIIIKHLYICKGSFVILRNVYMGCMLYIPFDKFSNSFIKLQVKHQYDRLSYNPTIIFFIFFRFFIQMYSYFCEI